MGLQKLSTTTITRFRYQQPYGTHSTAIDLRKLISTALIAFNGDDTGHGLWGCDEYQPVMNSDRLQVFFLSPYFEEFDFFACQILLFVAGSFPSPSGQKLYETRVLDIDETPDTLHLICLTRFKALLDQSRSACPFPRYPTPLRNAVNSFPIASSFVFFFYFLALIGPSISTILLFCIIDNYGIIYWAKLNTVQMAAGADSS